MGLLFFLRGSFVLLRDFGFWVRFCWRLPLGPARPGSSEKELQNRGVGVPGEDSGQPTLAIQRQASQEELHAPQEEIHVLQEELHALQEELHALHLVAPKRVFRNAFLCFG